MLTKPRNRILIVTVAIFILLATIFAEWLGFLYSPLITDEHGYKYTVKPGASVRAVMDDLYLLNIVKHPLFFRLLVKLKGNAHELKSGEYLFPKGTTAPQLLGQITTGSGVIYHIFTIIPGWSFRQLRAALIQNPDLDHSSQNLSDVDIMTKMGAAQVKPEGEFFPDTYYFVEGSSDIALLKRAYHAMQEKLKIAWEHRDTDVPYKTSYEALIVASLVEKEAEQDLERPIIAGVIINRLRKNMLLQIDPTVIYGMGTRFNGVIHRVDLLENTPYNTYVHKGLPPTPIATPSLESLNSAMHPDKHEFYYFVAKGTGEPTHQFTKTLADHYKAVADAKKFRPGFFNNDLIRFYLLKIVLPRHFI